MNKKRHETALLFDGINLIFESFNNFNSQSADGMHSVQQKHMEITPHDVDAPQNPFHSETSDDNLIQSFKADNLIQKDNFDTIWFSFEKLAVELMSRLMPFRHRSKPKFTAMIGEKLYGCPILCSQPAGRNLHERDHFRSYTNHLNEKGAEAENCNSAAAVELFLDLGLLDKHIGNGAGDANLVLIGDIDGESRAGAHDLAEALNLIAKEIENLEYSSHSAVFMGRRKLHRFNHSVQIGSGIQIELENLDKLIHLRLINRIVLFLAKGENFIIHRRQTSGELTIGQKLKTTFHNNTPFGDIVSYF